MTDRIRPGIPRYRAADVAVLRIPALPADGCTGLLAACRPDDPDWPATHRALLADAWRTPLLAAAVEHSAPDLARALTEAGGPDGPRTALALDRCLNRLSTRPTPFGLAAAVAAVPVARAGRPTGTDPGGHLLRLSGPARPVARPDAAAPDAAAPDPASSPHTAIGDQDTVVVSDLVHLLDGHPWREPAGRGAARWLRGSEPVRTALRAAARPVPVARLLAELTGHPGPVAGAAADGEPAESDPAAVAAARRLVRDLVRLGFLRPAGPGPGAPAPLLGLCERLNAPAEPAAALTRLLTALRSRPRPALHLDSVARPAPGSALDPQAARYAEQAAGLLALVGRGSRYPRYLARAAAAFLDHFGAHARVPALAAVHTLTDLRVLDSGPAPGPDGRDTLLATVVARALAERDPVRELDDVLLARLAADLPIDRMRPALPAADICLRLGWGPDGRIRAALSGPGAVPAGVAYGRASDLLDPAARAALRAARAAEEAAAPHHRFVELVYRPERRAAANVAAREPWRPRHLPVDVPAPGENLTLAEVSVGVRDGRFELYEAATGGLLHLTQASALDLRLAPPVCRFLLDASANQFRHPAPFDWGPAGQGPFRPRLERDGLVLAPAAWRPGRDELGDCSAKQVRGWAERWLAPRHVHLVQAGRQLLLDLDSAVSLAHLRHALDRADDTGLLLEEATPDPAHGPVAAADGGRHLLEAVIPVVLTAPVPVPDPGPAHPPATVTISGPAPDPASVAVPGPPSAPVAAPQPVAGAAATPSPATAAAPGGPRTSPVPPAVSAPPPGAGYRAGQVAPGWLSLHLYLRGPWQDALVADLAARRAELGRPGGGLFFLRYADPLEHLRIRVRYRPGLLEELLDWARGSAGRLPVHEVAVRAYRPEADRYGGPALIEAAERLFCADSAAVAGLLAGPPPDGLPRAVSAALTLDRYAALLVPDPAERRLLAARAADSRAGSQEHRRHGRELWRLRADPDGPAEPAAGYWSAPAAEYRRLLAEHWPGPAGADRRHHAVASLLHLHANRLGLDRVRERTALGLWRRLLEREARTTGTPAAPDRPTAPDPPVPPHPAGDPPRRSEPAKEDVP